MAATPKFKIYRDGEYIGCTKFAEDAAALVGLYGNGIVKYEHSFIVWREGQEEIEAGESYDRAAAIMNERLAARHRAHFERAYGVGSAG